jgi:hypothetical protein
MRHDPPLSDCDVTAPFEPRSITTTTTTLLFSKGTNTNSPQLWLPHGFRKTSVEVVLVRGYINITVRR